MLAQKSKCSLTGKAAVEVGITVEPIELRIHYESFTYKQKNHTQTFHFSAWGRQCMSNFFGFIRKCFFFWNERRHAWLGSLQKIIPLYCSVIMLLSWKKKTENEKCDTFVGASVKFETNNEHELIWNAKSVNKSTSIYVFKKLQINSNCSLPVGICKYDAFTQSSASFTLTLSSFALRLL